MSKSTDNPVYFGDIIDTGMAFALKWFSAYPRHYNDKRVNEVVVDFSDMLEIVRQVVGTSIRDYHYELKSVLDKKGIDIGEFEFNGYPGMLDEGLNPFFECDL